MRSKFAYKSNKNGNFMSDDYDGVIETYLIPIGYASIMEQHDMTHITFLIKFIVISYVNE